jgi:hypothetical protein
MKSKRMRREEYVALMGNAYRNIVGKPKGRRLYDRPRHRWKDNIKMDVKEIVCVCGLYLYWLNVGSSGGLLCEHGNNLLVL